MSIARAVSERDKTSCENTRRRMDRGCQNMSAAMWDWGWGDLESNGRGWQKSLQEAAWQKVAVENLPSVWDDRLDLYMPFGKKDVQSFFRQLTMGWFRDKYQTYHWNVNITSCIILNSDKPPRPSPWFLIFSSIADHLTALLPDFLAWKWL